ncbi:hypothetical protein ACQ86N_46725 [Puia sp. P3]|uniref:hypothetical protein n=1 Tax=Puia sp. P3 TaxID=3423952 RepID=UPI003D66E98E
MMKNADALLAPLTAEQATRELLGRHLRSFKENDLEAIVSDYMEESVLVTQKRTYTGIAEIRAFFSNLIVDFPSESTTFDLDILVVYDEVALIVWHAKTPTIQVIVGTDTFIVSGNKIKQQSFVDMMKFV